MTGFAPPEGNARRPTAADRAVVALAGRWRAVTLVAVIVLALAGWAYLLLVVATGGGYELLGPGMAAMVPLLERLAFAVPAVPGGHAAMGAVSAYGPAEFAAVFAMWAAMVFAMMLPTAAPMLRAYAAGGRSVLPVGLGYAAVWMGVAVAATALQGGLTAAGALAPHMAPAGVTLSASVLIAAGLYQFTPLKRVCLIRCRNPHAAASVSGSPGDALRVGVEEGLACLGCCWALMAVMLAAGLMNLIAMAVLGVLMGLEKIVSGLALTYAIGIILLLLGVGLASAPFFG